MYSTTFAYTYLWPISVFIPVSGLIAVVPVCILLPIVLVRFGSDAETQKYGQYRANMTTMSHCAIPSIDAYHLYISPRYSSAPEQCSAAASRSFLPRRYAAALRSEAPSSCYWQHVILSPHAPKSVQPRTQFLVLGSYYKYQ